MFCAQQYKKGAFVTVVQPIYSPIDSKTRPRKSTGYKKRIDNSLRAQVVPVVITFLKAFSMSMKAAED